MIQFWSDLSQTTQDVLTAIALCLPLLCVGFGMLRGYQVWPLVSALLRRFFWPNLIFVGLIAVSTGMGIGLITQERGLRIGTANAASKFELVVTAPGSEITAMMAAVYLQTSNMPLLDGQIYSEIATNPRVSLAAPIGFGDSYQGHPIVGTIAGFVTHLSDAAIDGALFQKSGEAVIGASVPLRLGQTFSPAHGHGVSAQQNAHDHDILTVVGQMPVTGSPWDKAILIPIETVWEIHGLANGHAWVPPTEGADPAMDSPDADRIGPPFDADFFPGTPAIIVLSTDLLSRYALKTSFTQSNESMAFFPGAVLANLYRVMGDIRQVMSAMTILAQTLVAISVLTGLFILTYLFRRQLAVTRALGAPNRFVVGVVWSYCVTLLMFGTLFGLVLGWATAQGLSMWTTTQTDILVQATLGWSEIHMAIAFLSATSVFSVLPALGVILRPVTEMLRS